MRDVIFNSEQRVNIWVSIFTNMKLQRKENIEQHEQIIAEIQPVIDEIHRMKLTTLRWGLGLITAILLIAVWLY